MRATSEGDCHIRVYAGSVPDISRFLPLSNRPKSDERGVSSDRHRALAAVVDEAARILAAVWGTDASAPAVSFVRAARLTAPGSGQATSAADLHRVAEQLRGGGRQSVKALARGVRALLVLAAEAGVEPRIDGTTLGIVALYGATSAPLERRVVVRGHALRATDAGWEFGRGPVLEGTALGIAAFLLGVTDEPPHPGPPHREEATGTSGESDGS